MWCGERGRGRGKTGLCERGMEIASNTENSMVYFQGSRSLVFRGQRALNPPSWSVRSMGFEIRTANICLAGGEK